MLLGACLKQLDTVWLTIIMRLISRNEYYKNRQEVSNKENCALCDNKQIVLGSSTSWTWIASSAPYWKYHTMIVPKRHIVEIFEINDKEWSELKQLEKLIVRKYKQIKALNPATNTPFENVLVFFRQRLNLHNPVLNAKNLDHLHLHFTFDKDHFLDPISDNDAHTWDIGVFNNSLDKELESL
jgi:diadenosine tetraphosphate (Ap4A) HIT family hydrolase